MVSVWCGPMCSLRCNIIARKWASCCTINADSTELCVIFNSVQKSRLARCLNYRTHYACVRNTHYACLHASLVRQNRANRVFFLQGCLYPFSRYFLVFQVLFNSCCYAGIMLLWGLGLRQVGPIRAVLLFDHHETIVLACISYLIAGTLLLISFSYLMI